MNINVIDSCQGDYLKNFYTSLNETIGAESYSISVEKESDFREKTLNNILNKHTSGDILIFADDVILTVGWYDALMNNKENADIIGFSNLYPNTNTIQDTGYDLVKMDGNVITEAINRGKNVRDLKSFKISQCDAVMGCAMYIKRRVIKKLNQFNLDGYNRWGEIIYCHKAQQNGFNVGVLGHFLYHHGKSTKNNKIIDYSTESYIFEKEQWKNVVDKYIDKQLVVKRKNIIISPDVINIMKQYKRIIFYGAGSVTELFLKKISSDRIKLDILVTSGLIEEHNKEFNNYKIALYEKVNFNRDDLLIITVLGRHKEIIDKIENNNCLIKWVVETVNQGNIIYNLVN